MAVSAAVYKPRNPQATDYYRCVEDHLETFTQVYEERFERTYGFFRPYLRQVIYRYLDCGDLHNGFARVKCKDCNHEYLLAFSCKRRHFCPSCHQKRVVEFGEWLCANVLKRVPRRHFVFSLPKILRRYFLYDRKLLHDLSRCAWESLKVFLQDVISEKNPVSGAVIAIQIFGDLLGFNPHCHILVTDGCFYGKDWKVFDAPEWLAAMCSHVPNRGEQMVRYYGWYSNVTRRKRQKLAEDEDVPYIIESDRSTAACRKSWARLLRKIYEVDPLICPKCRGTMRIISFIEDREIIKTLLGYLGLWLIRSRPPAKAHAPPARECAADASCHAAFPDDAVYGDPDYPWDAYILISRRNYNEALLGSWMSKALRISRYALVTSVRK